MGQCNCGVLELRGMLGFLCARVFCASQYPITPLCNTAGCAAGMSTTASLALFCTACFPPPRLHLPARLPAHRRRLPLRAAAPACPACLPLSCSRQRKNAYMKSLEMENRALKLENERLRSVCPPPALLPRRCIVSACVPVGCIHAALQPAAAMAGSRLGAGRQAAD